MMKSIEVLIYNYNINKDIRFAYEISENRKKLPEVNIWISGRRNKGSGLVKIQYSFW